MSSSRLVTFDASSFARTVREQGQQDPAAETDVDSLLQDVEHMLDLLQFQKFCMCLVHDGGALAPVARPNGILPM